jgi:hypothetical protein
VAQDIEALHKRREQIPSEILAEQDAIRNRYAEPTHRLFPAAVTLLIPEGVQL